MTLHSDLQASLAMEKRRERYEAEVRSLVSLARYQSRLAVRYSREGMAEISRKYRADSWWHFEKAHQKRALAKSRSHLREVA